MIYIDKLEIKYLKKISYLLLPLVVFGVTACTPPTQEEDIALFNKRFGPEYTFNRTHLLVNWQGDAKHGVQPLKLNIPVTYLRGEQGPNGEITAGITFALKPMKNGKIDTIYLKLRRSNGQPVPYVSPNKTDDPVITKMQKEIYSDKYVVQIFRDGKGDVLNRERDCCGEDEELFRGKDISGLEQYAKMTCYDVQALQKKALDPHYQESSKWTLKDLANKPSYDITPAHCLAVRNAMFWRSPVNTPQVMAVKIDSSLGFAGYQMKILYRNHLVIAYPRDGAEETAKNWKFYHQQITQVLDSMLVY